MLIAVIVSDSLPSQVFGETREGQLDMLMRATVSTVLFT